MYTVMAKKVPTMKWMTELSKKIVKEFNDSKHHLTLCFMVEPESIEDIEVLLDDGRYYFKYPDCPEAKALEEMLNEAEGSCKFLEFCTEDLYI